MESLTIIGASVRAAAQSARRAFFAPHAGDLFADLDLCETCPTTRIENYPRDLERVLAGEQSGGWMYTGGLENYPELIEHWSAIRPLYGNDAVVLRQVRDPLQVVDCMRGAGLPCPEVSMTSDGLLCDGSWLQKPLRSAGGVGVGHLTNNPIAEIKQPVYFQRYIEGTSCSAVFVATQGQAVLLGVSRQLLVENSFRYLGSIGPMPLAARQQQQFAEIGSALAAEFAMVGLFGVDAIVNKNGVWPVEVNPRYTASVEVLERSWDVPAIALHGAACREGSLPKQLPWVSTRVVGKAIWFAHDDFTVEFDLRELLEDVADVPAVGTQIRRNTPVATVLCTGREVEQVESALHLALQQLRSIPNRITGTPRA